MKIPKKLKVGGLIYEVKESEEVTYEGAVWGSTHFSNQKIFLEPNEKQQKKEEAFLHEIIHICLFYCGLSKRLKRLDENLEEDLVIAISNQLYQILKDNNLLRK
jgi:hypothetical protein